MGFIFHIPSSGFVERIQRVIYNWLSLTRRSNVIPLCITFSIAIIHSAYAQLFVCFTTFFWAQNINWWSWWISLFDVKSIINFLLAGNFDGTVKSRRFFYTCSTASSSWPSETESATVVLGLLPILLNVCCPQGRLSVSESRIPCSSLLSLLLSLPSWLY